MSINEITSAMGIALIIISGVLLFGSCFIPRRFWLKVKLEAIPDSIKGKGGVKWDSYIRPIFYFPFWMLNRRGKYLVAMIYTSMFVGFAILLFAWASDVYF